jgi:hypothetical protein
MKWISILSLFLAVCALLALPAWGQLALPQSTLDKLSQKKISHMMTTDTGQKVQLRLSYQAERLFRAQHSKMGPNGKIIGTSGGDPCTTNGNPLVYDTTDNGPVMRSPTNYVIMWQAPYFTANSDTFAPGYQTGVEMFFQSLGGTPFYNITTQYGDSTGVPVPNASTWGGTWVDTSNNPTSGNDGSEPISTCTFPHCPLSYDDIYDEVQAAIAANPGWVPYGINVEYFVLLPPNVEQCNDSTDCFALPDEGTNGTYCAWHTYQPQPVDGVPPTIFAMIPYGSYGDCYGSSTTWPNLTSYPNSPSPDVDITDSLMSHESIEANADPELDAWNGGGANALCNEEADKCAYYYGYVAPGGTNVVMNGNRFQIQLEWSNELVAAQCPTSAVNCACAKRYGPSPVVDNPGPVNFGVVQAGTSAQKSVAIQNSGGGDLNILNMRVASASPYYSLLNPQPTAATFPAGEGEDANVQFAPISSATFASPTGSLVVDTDQTPYIAPSAGNPTGTNMTAFVNISGTVGVPPDALCAPATVPTNPNECYASTASINNGSSNPDGDPYTLLQSPAGPYALGITPATLTITDDGPLGYGSASCKANVTVKDEQPPTLTCPAAQTLKCTSSSGAVASVVPTFWDNCPGATASCVPPSGTFGFGATPITCTATDTSGNQTICDTSVTVKDVPPTIHSIKAVPSKLKYAAITPVTIQVKDTDPCDPSPVCSITKVTANLSVPSFWIDITGPLTVTLQNAGSLTKGLKYTIKVTCNDHHGGSTKAQTTIGE